MEIFLFRFPAFLNKDEKHQEHTPFFDKLAYLETIFHLI